jgi:2-C-methyl-D-erythritol 4-phosphate cytidylyltransferase
MVIYCGVLASGKGERFSRKGHPKQLIPIAGSALFTETLKAVLASSAVDQIAIAVLPELEELFHQEIDKRFITEERTQITVVHGGSTRMNSILNIINHFKKSNVIGEDDILMIVDANRPLVSTHLYEQVIEAALNHDVSCPARPLVDGVATVDAGFITSIPNKRNIYSIQTPEACKFHTLNELIIQDLHLTHLGICEMFQAIGTNPKIVLSDFTTHKVTHKGDFEIIQTIMELQQQDDL